MQRKRTSTTGITAVRWTVAAMSVLLLAGGCADQEAEPTTNAPATDVSTTSTTTTTSITTPTSTTLAPSVTQVLGEPIEVIFDGVFSPARVTLTETGSVTLRNETDTAFVGAGEFGIIDIRPGKSKTIDFTKYGPSEYRITVRHADEWVHLSVDTRQLVAYGEFIEIVDWTRQLVVAAPERSNFAFNPIPLGFVVAPTLGSDLDPHGAFQRPFFSGAAPRGPGMVITADLGPFDAPAAVGGSRLDSFVVPNGCDAAPPREAALGGLDGMAIDLDCGNAPAMSIGYLVPDQVPGLIQYAIAGEPDEGVLHDVLATVALLPSPDTDARITRRLAYSEFTSTPREEQAQTRGFVFDAAEAELGEDWRIRPSWETTATVDFANLGPFELELAVEARSPRVLEPGGRLTVDLRDYTKSVVAVTVTGQSGFGRLGLYIATDAIDGVFPNDPIPWTLGDGVGEPKVVRVERRGGGGLIELLVPSDWLVDDTSATMPPRHLTEDWVWFSADGYSQRLVDDLDPAQLFWMTNEYDLPDFNEGNIIEFMYGRPFEDAGTLEVGGHSWMRRVLTDESGLMVTLVEAQRDDEFKRFQPVLILHSATAEHDELVEQVLIPAMESIEFVRR